MDKKTRFKITLDNELAGMLTKMAKERHQTKSVLIANLILEHEDETNQPTIMTDEQFQMMSSTLQKINNRLRRLGMEVSADDLRKVLVSVEEQVSDLDANVTNLVYH